MAKKLVAAGVGVMVLAVVLLVAACGGAGSTLPANVLGRVGKAVITRDQFNVKVAVFQGIYTERVPDKKTNPTKYKSFENAVLDLMVVYEVAKEAAASLKINVTDQDVKDQIDLVKKNVFGGDQSKFDAALTAGNLTLAQLQMFYQEEILIKKARIEVTKGVTGASGAEISAFYDAHRSSFVAQESRAVRHILIAPVAQGASSPGSFSEPSSSITAATPTATEWAAALAKAQKVRADLVAGADWKAEAAAFSDDPGSKTFGGDVGIISRGQMVTEFDQAAFSLAQGAISQPVKTAYGYHIIEVTRITPAKQLAFADVKSRIESTLLAQRQDLVWKDWVARKKAELKAVVAAGMEVPTTTTAAPSATSTSASTQTTGAGGSAITSPTATSAPLSSSTTSPVPQQATTTSAATQP